MGCLVGLLTAVWLASGRDYEHSISAFAYGTVRSLLNTYTCTILRLVASVHSDTIS